MRAAVEPMVSARLQGVGRAFGMHGHLGAGMGGLGPAHILPRQGVVNRAVAVPGDDVLFRHLPAHIIPQVFIGDE